MQMTGGSQQFGGNIYMTGGSPQFGGNIHMTGVSQQFRGNIHMTGVSQQFRGNIYMTSQGLGSWILVNTDLSNVTQCFTNNTLLNKILEKIEYM